MPANDPPPFQIIGYQAFPMRQSNHRFSIGDFPDLLDTPDSIKYFSLSLSLYLSLPLTFLLLCSIAEWNIKSS